MRKLRVLIFPAGAENAIEVFYSIKDHMNVEVFGASGKSDHAGFIYDRDHYFEDDFYINRTDFVDKFSNLCQKLKIDVVIPTHDTIALYFAQNAERFPVRFLTANYKTALICREKRKTYELFSEYDFCPKIFAQISEIKDNDFPIFLKPNIGEGAKGVRVANTLSDIAQIDLEDMVICELLPGEEYTVDCFTNRQGELLFCGMRTRERIQMGIAFRSQTVELPLEIAEIAAIINEKLNFLGGWFFQVKKDVNGKFKLLEISCRMAGTMTLHRHKGINFSLLGIFETMGIQTSIINNPFNVILDRRLEAQFQMDYDYNVVYLDYDDTLSHGSFVNTNVITFLYQCKKRDIKIILLTRHEGDLFHHMNDLCIHRDLFEKIIHISFDENKEDYIDPDKAIFIDNSFAERKKISMRYNIPVFDTDAVDMLIQK